MGENNQIKTMQKDLARLRGMEAKEERERIARLEMAKAGKALEERRASRPRARKGPAGDSEDVPRSGRSGAGQGTCLRASHGQAGGH